MAERLIAEHGKKIAKFAIVGALSTAIDWAIYLALVNLIPWWHQNYVGAKVLSTAGGTVNGFFWNKFWTFRNGSKRYVRQLAKQAIAGAASVGLNALIVFILVDFAKFDRASVVTIAIATAIVFFFNYPVNRYWVFREYTIE